jgi:hypothetical protein
MIAQAAFWGLVGGSTLVVGCACRAVIVLYGNLQNSMHIWFENRGKAAHKRLGGKAT